MPPGEKEWSLGRAAHGSHSDMGAIWLRIQLPPRRERRATREPVVRSIGDLAASEKWREKPFRSVPSGGVRRAKPFSVESECLNTHFGKVKCQEKFADEISFERESNKGTFEESMGGGGGYVDPPEGFAHLSGALGGVSEWLRNRS